MCEVLVVFEQNKMMRNSNVKDAEKILLDNEKNTLSAISEF
jgi:hypothetical protein